MSKKSKKNTLEKEEKAAKAKKSGKQKEKKKTKKDKSSSTSKVSREQRLEMIATAAYYIAERHGFTPGESQADWRAAEKEIDALLKQKGKKKGKH